MSNLLADAWARLLADHCSPETVRRIEAGGDPLPLAAAIEASGFLDALRPETDGGAGLTLADALPLLEAEGAHALPLPAGATLIARATLAAAGSPPPTGFIAIAEGLVEGADGTLQAIGVELVGGVNWVVADAGAQALLLPVAGADRLPDGIHGSLRGDLRWPAWPPAARRLAQPTSADASRQAAGWRDAGAVLTAARLAGAMHRVLDMTVAFANQREQFGRPIGQFQAIQHHLAVMAEQTAAAGMAAAIGLSDATAGLWPQRLRAAVAKARCSEAAVQVATLAHAVHGAIGVTAEFDLQLLTRRLHAGRLAFGAESVWHRAIGQALLADTGRSTLDFMRERLLPRSPLLP